MVETKYDRLKEIVGADRVDTTPKMLDRYSKDQSFVRPCTPDCVVFAQSVPEVQEVVRAANYSNTPVVPVSSAMNLRGAAIPKEGGIILDVSKMNKIGQVNERERWVVIQPGVTYGQLTEELEKHNLRVMMPLGIPRSRSVVSSIMELDPTLASANQEYGTNLYMDFEVVLPTGEVLRTGKWAGRISGKYSAPGGGVTSLAVLPWLWQVSQGTLGIVTGLNVKAEHLPKASKVFVFPFDRLDGVIEAVRRIEKKELGMECFALNNFNLAAVRTEDWDVPQGFPCPKVASNGFDSLRTRLPKWTLIIHLTGLLYFPEEQVAYQEADLRDVCNEMGLTLTQTVAGETGLDATLLDLITHPWMMLRKACFKGSFHPITFYTPLGRVPEFEEAILALARRHGYPLSDVGGYLLVVERGRYGYCEFDFHCDLDDGDDVDRVRTLWLEANEVCANMGALLAKPYGPCADIIYRRVDPAYVATIKGLKRVLDPNNILNPGKLCF